MSSDKLLYPFLSWIVIMEVLDSKFEDSHDLCFLIHDIMVQLLHSAEKQKAFNQTFDLTDVEAKSLESTEGHIIEWLEDNKKYKESSLVIRSTVLPALLSDMMHCIYETLQASKKGKLTIAYMLIRKPLQESLFVLESMALDRKKFIEDFTNEQKKLSPSSTGGLDGHISRIEKVLKKLDFPAVESFDASYIAQLRYDKSIEDSFDGVCNKAMHLFTSRKTLKTESRNINFIFARGEQYPSLWAFSYSRLPYLLYYIYQLVEHICAELAPTHPSYLKQMNRWIAAKVLVSYPSVEERYRHESLDNLFASLTSWLESDCIANGFSNLDAINFEELVETGIYNLR